MNTNEPNEHPEKKYTYTYFRDSQEALENYHRMLSQGTEVSSERLQEIAAQRRITHVELVSIKKAIGAVGLRFLTQDQEKKSYIYLGEVPVEVEKSTTWLKLQTPVDIDIDKCCWQTDGGSVWYGKYENIFDDQNIQLLIRGPEEDTFFERDIGELRHRQYYNEEIQKILDKKCYPEG